MNGNVGLRDPSPGSGRGISAADGIAGFVDALKDTSSSHTCSPSPCPQPTACTPIRWSPTGCGPVRPRPVRSSARSSSSERLGVRAHADGRDIELAGDRGAREAARSRTRSRRDVSAAAADRRPAAARTERRWDHDRLHPGVGRHVEQRGARVRRFPASSTAEHRAARLAPVASRARRAPASARPNRRATRTAPGPHVQPTNAAGSAGAEHLCNRTTYMRTTSPPQDPLSFGPVRSGLGHDRVPLVLRLPLAHRREPREIRDGRRGRIEARHPSCVKRRVLPRVAQQRPQALGPVALDPIGGPVDARDVILQRRAHGMHMGRTQRRVRTLLIHASGAHPYTVLPTEFAHWPMRRRLGGARS